MADELENESAVALLEFKNGRKTVSEDDLVIKQEMEEEEDEDIGMDVDDDDDITKLGPAALGLQRVGAPTTPKPSPTQPIQTLNARGMPARIRKKNRLFFDDDIVNTPHHRVPSSKKQKATPTKKPKPTPPKELPPRIIQKKILVHKDIKHHMESSPTIESHDRKIGQKIGMRLRNLLKLPKAHKWVCFEWFYSNIDRVLFEGDNDFTICLKESFPELKTRDLTRIEWTKIRRMMGRPRRCSQAFFNQERLDLERKRNKIRALQQRKFADLSGFQDLPSEIPMQLVIGTKVTARLRKPQDGLFTGSVDAVDTSNNTYRITFERQGLGTHSVPDYEVLSNESPDTMTISNFQNKNRPRNGVSPYMAGMRSPSSSLKQKRDPLLSGLLSSKSPFLHQKSGGYPDKLLEKIVYVIKILDVKKEKVEQLKNMNSEAEKYNLFAQKYPNDFEKRYATILIDLERLNKDLQMYLDDVQALCQEIAPEPSLAAMLAPSHLREKCKEEAQEIVQRNNNNMASEAASVNDDDILDLITDLTALMLQVKSLSDSDQNAYELQVLQGTMEQIKRKLSPENQVVFHKSIEVHMKYIQVGLSQANTNKISNTPAKAQ